MAMNIRALAAKCCFNVVDKGRSLTEELPNAQAKADTKDKALLQELCYGVLRYLPELEHNARTFIDKPLKSKQRVFHFLILVGLYQLKYLRIPDHAAVAETVAGCKPLKNLHLKGLVNAVLRGFQRQQQDNNENVKPVNDAVKYNHPSWFIKHLQQAYPDNWQVILHANMSKPPMWLRVNQQHHTPDNYRKKLIAANIAVEASDEKTQAILLTKAVDVDLLPDFHHGHVSIQDAAAQQAAVLLGAQKGEHILDCCAAPGGKTCHILELANVIMTAIDVEAERLARVQENLTRLNLTAQLITGDATDPASWWQGEQFDRILLDAPCSATGVIRRHPDIKWLRKAEDIEKLQQLQQQILKNIWPLLKSGGTLLYATCSVLPQENDLQITQFLAEHQNATLEKINADDKLGWQILPNENNMDGFYYAKLIKA